MKIWRLSVTDDRRYMPDERVLREIARYAGEVIYLPQAREVWTRSDRISDELVYIFCEDPLDETCVCEELILTHFNDIKGAETVVH